MKLSLDISSGLCSVPDSKIWANRGILASRSPVFRALLFGVFLVTLLFFGEKILAMKSTDCENY
jgi:hypothetical protein